MSWKLLTFALLACLSASAGDTVIGGPFVVNDSGRTATVVWIVQTDSVSVKAQGAAEVKTSPALHAESVTLTGLKAGTVYEYSVPGKDVLRGSFKTPPAAGAPFEFIVYGDNRTRHDVHRKVAAAVLKYSNPDFVLQTGDMVESGSDPALWPIFFDIERELLRKTAIFPAIGNHERNARDYFEFFQAAPYYSFNWGSAHIAVFNSDYANTAPGEAGRQAFWNEQKAWLEEDLKKNQNAAFRFVAAHHPPMSAVAKRQEFNAHVGELVPIFEQNHVTAALFGHDHNYQHYLKNGIHYVISGGGGAPLYDVSSPPAGIMQKVVSVENFVRIQFDGKVMHVTGISADGETLDTFDLTGTGK